MWWSETPGDDRIPYSNTGAHQAITVRVQAPDTRVKVPGMMYTADWHGVDERIDIPALQTRYALRSMFVSPQARVTLTPADKISPIKVESGLWPLAIAGTYTTDKKKEVVAVSMHVVAPAPIAAAPAEAPAAEAPAAEAPAPAPAPAAAPAAPPPTATTRNIIIGIVVGVLGLFVIIIIALIMARRRAPSSSQP